MRFRKVWLASLLAYLSGWPFVQAAYNRLFGAWKRREMLQPNGEYQTHLRAQAQAIIEQLHVYKSSGQEPPAALDVIMGLHAEVQRLRSFFPYEEGETLVLGPEVFAHKSGHVLCWAGRNYVPQEEACPEPEAHHG